MGTVDALNPPVDIELAPKPFPLAAVVLAPNEKIAVEFVVVALFSKGLTVEVVAKIVFAVPNPGVCVVEVPPNIFVELFKELPNPEDVPKTDDEVVLALLNVFDAEPNDGAAVVVVFPNEDDGAFWPKAGMLVLLKGELVIATELPKLDEVVTVPPNIGVLVELKPPVEEASVVGKLPAAGLCKAPKPPNPVELFVAPKLGAVDDVFSPKPPAAGTA